ncbi:asparagine synthetase B family protein [Paraglaciecola sp.]|uniref:asparagine synthetase B family protein n=1 Tax=Paraglaciecola sp. TaxID=1920173 RepID=UPI0030F3CE97
MFAYITSLSSNQAYSQQWLSKRLDNIDGGIVTEIFVTKNPHLTMGSFFMGEDHELSRSNIGDFHLAEDGDCILCRANLSTSDHVRPSSDPAGVIKIPYAAILVEKLAEQGGDFISQIEGSAVYFAWDQQARQLHIGKDPLNASAVYWLKTNNGVLISTDLRFLSLVVNKPLTLSEKGLASWLSGYPNPAISLFNEINVLESGKRLAISHDLTLTQHRFWDIDPSYKLYYSSQADYSERFRELLTDSVRMACNTDKQLVVSQMSGGLDSTSITSLAKDLLQADGKQVLPLSHLYSQAEHCDESVLIQQMLDFLTLENSLQLTVDGDHDRNFLNLYPTALESPGTVLSPRYVSELAAVKSAGADVMLSGNGGDEMCWGHSVAYTQRLRQGEIGVVKEVLRACKLVGMSRKKTLSNLFVKPFLPDLLLRILGAKQASDLSEGLPVWLSAKAKALALEETQIANPFNPKLDLVGFNRYQGLKTTATYNAIKSYQQLSQRFGIDVRHPFFNTALAEFTFAVPAKQLIQGAYPKWLLRHSMDKNLPASVCWNIKKVTFDQHFGNLVRENSDEIRALFKHDKLADLGLVDRDKLLAELDRVVSDNSYPLHVDLLYAILTYTWLNTHFPEEQ